MLSLVASYVAIANGSCIASYIMNTERSQFMITAYHVWLCYMDSYGIYIAS